MWLVMIISYSIVTIIDTGSFTKQESQGQLYLYVGLMVISCAIGIANGYVSDMPSPADAISAIVSAFTGR